MNFVIDKMPNAKIFISRKELVEGTIIWGIKDLRNN